MAQLAIGLGVGLGALLLLLIAAGVFLCKRNQVKRASTPVASSKALLDDCGGAYGSMAAGPGTISRRAMELLR